MAASLFYHGRFSLYSILKVLGARKTASDGIPKDWTSKVAMTVPTDGPEVSHQPTYAEPRRLC